MKMTRNELKDLVKECLVEILSEGMGNSAKLKESFAFQEKKAQKKPADMISYGQRNQIMDKKRISEVIKTESKGDPILAAILADTASTTLPNMLMNEGHNHTPQPVGSVERIVASTNPEELFGDEAASKWAALAFMDVSKKF
jgi:hypothetical protein